MSLPPEPPEGLATGGPMANQPKPNPPGKNGFKYREKFGIVVICDSAEHQARLYDALKAQGLKLKVVVV